MVPEERIEIQKETSQVETTQKEESAPQTEEKILYDTKCATCDIDIQVPFKPDGNRPTFCKDCLRDYQRATAKVRLEIERKNNPLSETKSVPASNKSYPAKGERHVYAPKDKPMALSQTRTVAPKKFKGGLRQKPQVNLEELRSLIDATRETAE